MNRLNIVVATWNSFNTIGKFFESINIDSIDFDVRIFIQDNVSDDDTLIVSEEYKKKFNSKVDVIINVKKDNGIYNAWNNVLKNDFNFSKNDYIMFIGSDDYFECDFFDGIKSHLLKLKQFDVLYSDVYVDFGNNFKKKKVTITHPEKKLHKYMAFSHPTMVINYNLIKSVGYFDESFRIAGDYDLIYRLNKEFNLNYLRLDSEPLINFSYGGISSGHESKLKAIKEKIKVKRKNDVFPLYYFDLKTIKSFIAYKLKR